MIDYDNATAPSLRLHIATQLLAGMLASPNGPHHTLAGSTADSCLAIADRLIAENRKPFESDKPSAGKPSRAFSTDQLRSWIADLGAEIHELDKESPGSSTKRLWNEFWNIADALSVTDADIDLAHASRF